MGPTTTSSPRQRYARGEGDRLRIDLLNAAAELMATHGTIESISLRAVAREAGVSPTAVYRHFDDHLDLLRESVEFCWTNFYDAIQAGRDNYVDFAMSNRGQYRVLFSNRIDLGMEKSEPGLTAFQILVDLVRDILHANGDGRDPYYVAIQTHTWIHGIVDLCGGHPDMPWPETSEMLDGLALALGLINVTG